MLPALEEALAGLAEGDEKNVSLSPEQGYGLRDASLVETVPLDSVPEAAREAGVELIAQSSEGQRRLVRVQEVREDEIVIDLNHPMAGESLHFALKVVAVE
jgi:FKBP-type peptidyl-prolyl cis-trans isomerase SlyD